LGDDELARDVAIIRDLEQGEQREVPLGAVIDELTAAD
jgi:histidyl-tRNA synthetase